MRLTKYLKIMFGICFLVFLQPLKAQTIIHASIDSTLLMIGEQATIHVEVVTNKDKKIEWPVFSDTLVKNIMILESFPIDTSKADNDRILLKKDYLITSFDSALYVIPPFTVIDALDTLQSNALVLKVVTFPEIDPENGFYDIKTVLKPDFVFSDYYIYVWIVLLSLFLFCMSMYIIQKRKKKEPVFGFIKNKPKLPPHVEAISKLDKIKQEKLWQQGRNKEYYTQITEVLRIYLMDRFGIYALEMTSDEILEEIQRLQEVHSTSETLKQILELADLVKFAKYTPLPNDNEMTLLNAYLFINQTKIEELQQPSVDKNGSEEEKRNENKANN